MLKTTTNKNSQNGATLVEASIGFFIFMILLAGFFDIFAILYNKATLNTALAETSRKAALSRNLNCPTIISTAIAEVNSQTQARGISTGVVMDNGSGINTIDSDITHPVLALHMKVTLTMGCLFCMILGNATIGAETQVQLENKTSCP